MQRVGAIVRGVHGQRAIAGRVLIVDDEPTLRRSLARCLIAHGLEVDSAASAEQAVQRLTICGPVDAVITDQVMGERSGLDLLRWLRGRMPRVRRLLVSGGGVPQLDRHLRDGLIEQFLEKPVDCTRVLVCLRKMLAVPYGVEPGSEGPSGLTRASPRIR